MIEYGKENEFYSTNYKAATGNFDLYVLFIERGFNLLKDQGSFGMILPNKFFQSEFGVGARSFIKNKNSLREIVNFKDTQVFDGATTYTAILFLEKMKNNDFKHIAIKDQDRNHVFDLLDNRKLDFGLLALSDLEDRKWIFSSTDDELIFKKINSFDSTLGDFCDCIFQGIASGADPIFFLKTIEKNSKTTKIFSKQLDKRIDNGKWDSKTIS